MKKQAAELRLLLDCVSRSPLEVPESLDWRRFLELTAWHGLSGLVLNALDHERLLRQVPAETVGSLRESHAAAAAVYRDLAAELGRVLAVLEREGIRVILLKGLALAEPVYGDPALRPMSDLDLMVPDADLDRADRLVRGLGYSCAEAPDVQAAMRETHRHYPRLTSRDGFYEIELHRHVVSRGTPLFFDVSKLWSGARPVTIAGHRALALGPEDLLTHLCLAFFLDRRLFYQSYRALGQLVDIARTLERYSDEIDWEVFVKAARRNGHSGVLFCALRTTEKLLRTRPSKEVLEELQRPLTSETASPERARLFIERKVLERRPWFFHELVSPTENAISNLIRSALRRMFFDRGYLAKKYSLPYATRGPSHLVLRHALDLTLLLKRFLFHPRQLAQEFRVDRWMHSLETGES